MSFISIQNLSKTFDVSKPFLQRVLDREGKLLLKAVQDTSFTIEKGKTFALVGESGSGKSTIAKLIVGLLAPTAGEIHIDNIAMAGKSQSVEMRLLRKRIAMIFQDPFASLNPRWRVRDTICEPLVAFDIMSDEAEIDAEVARLLTLVGLNAADSHKYPHEFSGGQRQRIAIARALAARPEFIVCDEPTSALDVSVQAQILNLMKDLQAQFNLTYLIISHNLAVVKHMADDIGVLYLGRLVEIAPAKQLFKAPQHPYTKMLLEAVPNMLDIGVNRKAVEGEIPNAINPPSGCAFHPRCPEMQAGCKATVPQLKNGVACLLR
jgi:peptide/nickel transport system ATP-binding protein